MKKVSVLVSGASVAGLSTAYWLCRYGFEVVVVELAPGLRPGGQALDIRGPALDVAERMGILAEARRLNTRLRGVSIVDARGKEIFRSTERTFTGGRLDSPDVEIMREDLCSVLHQLVDGRAEYLFGDSIASLVQDEHGVHVTFRNAAPRTFDLVVGADGVHSNVRRLVFGPEKSFIHYMGRYLTVFTIPNFLGLDHWQTFTWEPLFGGMLSSRHSANATTNLIFETDKPLDYDYHDVDAQKRLVAGQLALAGWELPRAAKYMWDAPDFHLDSVSQIHMDRWSQGRVVLVGDAAFCPSPSGGQGATMSMVASYVLGGELAASAADGDLLGGLAPYEAELREYVAQTQTNSLNFRARARALLSKPEDGAVPDFAQATEHLALKDY